MSLRFRTFRAPITSAFGLAVTSHVLAQDTVQMGAVLSLTCANATVGEDVRRAVALAVNKVNADGGVLGKKFSVIVEDSGGNATTALNAACKLVSVDKVPVVIGEYSSGITLPMAQYLVKASATHLFK